MTARLEFRRISAEAHRATELSALAALLEFVAAHPFRHHRNDRLVRFTELSRAGVVDVRQIARRFEARHLHSEADAEVGHTALAREFRSQHLAFRPTFAEPARHENAVEPFEIRRRIFALEDLAFDPLEVDLDPVGDAAVNERLVQRLISVLEPGVLADDGDRNLALGLRDAARNRLPPHEIGLRRTCNAERREHLAVEPFAVICQRHVIDGRDVERLNDGLGADVAEQRDLLALADRNIAIGTAEQNVGLDADRAQLLDRMLRRLGLQLARGRNVGHQRQVDEDRRAARKLVTELADRFEERQALDVADRAADFDEHEIHILVAREHEAFDRVGDVRNDLHGAAEKIAPPLLGENVLIDAPRRDVIRLFGRNAREPLIMAEVEVRLGTVIGDENLPMLIRAHRARIDIQVGIKLLEPDRITTRLKKRAKGGGSETFSKGGDHAAGDEDIPLHGPWFSHSLTRIRKRLFCIVTNRKGRNPGSLPNLATLQLPAAVLRDFLGGRGLRFGRHGIGLKLGLER